MDCLACLFSCCSPPKVFPINSDPGEKYYIGPNPFVYKKEISNLFIYHILTLSGEFSSIARVCRSWKQITDRHHYKFLFLHYLVCSYKYSVFTVPLLENPLFIPSAHDLKTVRSRESKEGKEEKKIIEEREELKESPSSLSFDKTALCQRVYEHVLYHIVMYERTSIEAPVRQELYEQGEQFYWNTQRTLFGYIFKILPSIYQDIKGLQSLPRTIDRCMLSARIIRDVNIVSFNTWLNSENENECYYMTTTSNVHKEARKIEECIYKGNIKRTAMFYDPSPLTEIPSFIGCLAHLRELDLSNHKIVQLPGELAHLSKLEMLDLSNNRLIEFPETVMKGLKGLKTLGINDNLLIRLPIAAMFNLKKLTYLNVSNNPFPAPRELCNSLLGLKLPKLQHIVLNL